MFRTAAHSNVRLRDFLIMILIPQAVNNGCFIKLFLFCFVFLRINRVALSDMIKLDPHSTRNLSYRIPFIFKLVFQALRWRDPNLATIKNSPWNCIGRRRFNTAETHSSKDTLLTTRSVYTYSWHVLSYMNLSCKSSCNRFALPGIKGYFCLSVASLRHFRSVSHPI